MTACGGAGDEGWSAAGVAEDAEAPQRCREGTAGGGEEWAVFGAAAVVAVVVDRNAVVVVGLGSAARGGGVIVACPARWVRGWDPQVRDRGRGEGVPRDGGSARPSRGS